MTVSSGVAQSDPDDDPVEALILPEEAQTLAPREQPAPTLPPRPAPSPTGRPEGARRPAEAPSTPAVDGRAVPGYEILGELGRGGMGVVYKARHLRLDRVVALKMILSGAHAGALELGRFRTEAEAVARLTHPGIVAIYEVGEHEGRPWFALEFVDGGSLSARCTGTPLPPAEAAVLVEKLADAMAHAHARGVVHRDLKPANVLLTRAGEPKVTDFGLARKLGASDGLTASGAIMGTPSYMAPEQAGGNSKAIGPAADVYALGAVLYELLTGRPPFRAASLMDTLMQVVSDDPVPPSRLQSRLPRDLETVCLKCLSKDPGRRYATADELADDLRRFRNGEPVRARPVGPAERAVKWVRRRPATAALLALLAVTTATGFGLVTWKWLDADRARGEANSAREEAVQALAKARAEQAKADSERSRAETQLSRSESLLYANGIRLAERELLAGDKASAVQLLDECRRDLRGWEWHFLRRQLALGSSATWTGLEQPVGPVAFGPDGSLLAGGGGGKLFVLDPAGKEVRSWLGPAPVRAIAWAADGKLLASGDLAGNVAVRTAVGDSLVTIRAHTKGVTSLAFAPDGRTLASGGADALAVLWDAVTGRELHICGGHGGPVLAVAFSPDGQTLATASSDKTVKLWDVATGANRYTYREHQQSVGTVAFSPDGRHIASGASDLRLWPAAGGDAEWTLNEDVALLAFHPGGKRMFALTGGRALKILDAATGDAVLTLAVPKDVPPSLAVGPNGHRLAGGRVTPKGEILLWDGTPTDEAFVLHLRGPVADVAFSPDGGRLAAGTGFPIAPGSATVWETATARPVALLHGHLNSLTRLSFSPDGTLLATAGLDCAVLLTDVASARVRRRLIGHTGAVAGLAWSPDGALLASTGGDHLVLLWDAEGKEVRRLHAGSVGLALAFSPDGKTLAVAELETVRLYDVATGEERRRLPAGRAVTWSRDGRHLASAAANGTVLIFDAVSGHEVRSLQGAFAPGALAYTPDGKHLAVAAGNGVLVWDLAQGGQPTCLTREARRPGGVVFSPDGQLLAAGVNDEVRVWERRRWEGE
jgi:WD40 repeat protein